jgi:cellulose synthase/poly-beta-1,6-N-acetylglucosamine synthase-like glycosyltransferase
MMYIWVSFFIVSLMLLGASLACFFDHRRRRLTPFEHGLSFIIPCYNDADTVARTVRSIFDSWHGDRFEVIVANDASTDHSAVELERLRTQYPIRVEHNPANLGKAETLNRVARMAAHEVIVFVDADTSLNVRAINDMTARLAHDPRLGAVSCPYRPANHGWLPRLQSIDYSMIALLQGAYNIFSGLALWGGCIAVRKEAFQQAGCFSLSAITEDVDLAYTLNRAGWRVEQSLFPVASHVPDSIRTWFRQKIRWTAGGFQCLIRHPAVWLRNPLQVLLIALYSVLSLNAFGTFIMQTMQLDRLYDHIAPLASLIPASQIIDIIEAQIGTAFAGSLRLMTCFTLLSTVYVVPLISKWRDSPLLLLIVPFSLIYFPLYTMISIAGLAYLLTNARRIQCTQRAW